MMRPFHLLGIEADAVSLPLRFTCPFLYEPHPLALIAVRETQDYVSSHSDWADELAEGKMLGVLVARDNEGRLGFLAAYSGNVATSLNRDYFVPPVYDLLEPNGEFKRGEAQITAINREVEHLEQSPELAELNSLEAMATREMNDEITGFKELMSRHKQERDRRRATGVMTDAQLEEMLNESRFEKAELKRIRRRYLARLQEITDKIADHDRQVAALKARRKAMSERLQERVFRLFAVKNARGEQRDLVEIFAPLGTLPPAGAGECCAPRLLNYAFNNCLKPVCMAEFWWGDSPAGEVRHHGHFYPACRSKCKPILDFMLQGLDVDENPLAVSLPATRPNVVFEDEWLAVLSKPAGMLTVPGKLLEDSLLTRFQAICPKASGPIVVHRLDQETSGLVIFAKDKATHKALQEQFEARRVKKRYVALLDGELPRSQGLVDLPLRPDVDDRPRQRVDFLHGRRTVTRYRVLEASGGVTRVALEPVTGRTHQLRVHCSHPLGLNCPIVGDRLYGKAASRLMLHAQSITFTHPATLVEITVESPVEF